MFHALKRGRWEGLIWLFLGLGLCLESIRLNLGKSNQPGPGFMPFISGFFLGLLGLILIVRARPQGVTQEKEEAPQKIWSGPNWRDSLFPLFTLWGYVLLFDHLGFFFSSFLFLFLLFKMTSPKKWIAPLISSGMVVTFSYLFFSVWLKCQFPKGWLTI